MEPGRINISSIKDMYPNLANDFKMMFKTAYSFPKREQQLYFLINCFFDGILPKHLQRRVPVKNQEFFRIIRDTEEKLFLQEIKLQISEIEKSQESG